MNEHTIPLTSPLLVLQASGSFEVAEEPDTEQLDAGQQATPAQVAPAFGEA